MNNIKNHDIASTINICSMCKKDPKNGCIVNELTRKRLFNGYMIVAQCTGFETETKIVANQ